MPDASPEEPEIAAVAALLDAFVAGSGALAAIALVDRGEGRTPAMVEAAPGEPAEVRIGDHAWTAGPPVEPAAALTLPDGLGRIAGLPALDVDAARGEIAAPLGAVAAIARAVRDLAGHLEGRGVATVRFATTDPDAPLTVAARPGDPLVLAIGDEQFEMPPGWP